MRSGYSRKIRRVALKTADADAALGDIELGGGLAKVRGGGKLQISAGVGGVCGHEDEGLVHHVHVARSQGLRHKLEPAPRQPAVPVGLLDRVWAGGAGARGAISMTRAVCATLDLRR